MRFMIAGGAPVRDVVPGRWGGHSWRTTWQPRRFVDPRPDERVPRVNVDLLERFVDTASAHDGVLCETDDALALVQEWQRRGVRPRPILALEVQSLRPMEGMRAWYRENRGVDPWPLLRDAPWVSWLAASAPQEKALLGYGIPAERVHRFTTGSSVYSMLLPDAEEAMTRKLSLGPAGSLAAGTVLFPGSGRRDWATILRTVMALPELPCVVVGGTRGPLTNHLKKWQASWPGNLSHLEFVPLDDFIEMVRAARVVVIPLLAGEGDGGHTTVVLANRVGVPVVCTDSPGLADYYEPDRTARLVQAEDVSGLAEAIRDVCSDEALRVRLVTAGRELEKKRDVVFRRDFERAITRAVNALEAQERSA